MLNDLNTDTAIYDNLPHGPRGGGGDWFNPSGTLDIFAAYQPIGAADFATSLVDLTGNGNDAGDPGGGGTPTWDADNGWIFDGATQYLTTTFVPSNDQTQSVIVQYTDATTDDAYLVGCQQAAGRILGLIPLYLTGAQVFYLNGFGANVVTSVASGNLCVAGNRGYRNGVAEGATINAWAGETLQALYIACRNTTGTPGQFLAVRIQALAIYNVTLTAPQVATIAARMANF